LFSTKRIKGPSTKDVCTQGRGRFVQCGKGGFFTCRCLHLLVQNTSDFLKSAQTREKGVEPVQTFCRKGGGGQFVAILCGCPLWGQPLKQMLFNGSSKLG